MSTYLILFAVIAVIYFVLVRNRPAPKTDWENLPTLNEYKKLEKSVNADDQLCCRFCGSSDINKRLLQSKKENPDDTKYYHACAACRRVLWRSVVMLTDKKEDQ
ncbi:MAG: hypothetical protein ACJAZP_000311 [Psychromonas sp.]|jgi:hypothetical protein|uniref:hypothetical protein n=1 Tax=Psychromonas sp. TaxID=1884585 RepID=UPI0039E2C4B2